MNFENTLNGGYNGLYGEVVTEDCYLLKQLDFKPNVIFDLGANIGVFARYALELFPDAHIICVEPNKDNFDILSNYTNGNVTFINKGIGNKVAYRLENTINGAHESYIDDEIGSEMVECVTLYEITNKYKKEEEKSFLKIDIEGNEKTIWTDEKSMDGLKKFDFIAMELHFLHKNWEEIDKENTLKMMDYLSNDFNCEFKPPMFYAKKK